MRRGFALTLVVGLVGACGLTGSDRREDVLHEEDAAELARYSAQLLVRNEPAVLYASAHFYFEDGECAVPLEDAEVTVNGTPLPGEISATALVG